jgi:hypothetical protein
MMHGDRVRDQLSDDLGVRVAGGPNDLLCARCRVVDLLAGAFKTPLEGMRILPKVMHEAGKRGSALCPKLCAPRAGRIRDQAQMLSERLPLPLVSIL